MKRFILKVVLLTGITLVIMVLLNSLYIRTNVHKNDIEKAGTGKFDQVPRGLQLVNLGSSHGEWAFDYSGAGNLNGFNMALSSQDFHYDYLVLKRYRENLSPGSVVLIPVSYFSFGISVKKDLPFDYRYYGILPYSVINGHNLTDYLKYRWCPILFSGYDGIKALFADEKFQIDPDKVLKKNNYSPGALKSFARNRAEYHKQIMKNPKSDHDFNINSLEKLLGYCKKEGLKPVFITTPYTDYYNSNFSKAFYRDFHGTIESMQERYDVPYLDYSNDRRFSGSIQLFRDSDHLNLPGRTLFTGIVIDDLRKDGQLE
jgi:hypothetical protein